jgi:hypothetical protein
MSKSTETIKEEIEKFKASQGGDYPEFYIGITNDPQRRLVENILIKELVEHVNSGLFKENSPHYQAEAESRDEAVKIERHFQHLGMKGYNPRSFGRETSNNVYCFKIAEDFSLIQETEGNSDEGKSMAKSIKKFEEFSKHD